MPLNIGSVGGASWIVDAYVGAAAVIAIYYGETLAWAKNILSAYLLPNILNDEAATGPDATTACDSFVYGTVYDAALGQAAVRLFPDNLAVCEGSRASFDVEEGATIGEELVSNNDFSAWTDPTVPDGWTDAWSNRTETTYVEEAIGGGLHVVSDGTGVAGLITTAGIGTVYPGGKGVIEIDVAAVATGSFRFYINRDPVHTISAPGVYTFEVGLRSAVGLGHIVYVYSVSGVVADFTVNSVSFKAITPAFVNDDGAGAPLFTVNALGRYAANPSGIPFVRHEPAMTNKCTCAKIDPTVTTGLTVNTSGDTNLVISVVDDAAELTLVGLDVVCTTDDVYKLDASACTGWSRCTISGQMGTLNPHSARVYARGDAFWLVQDQYRTGAYFDASAHYAECKYENFTPLATYKKIGLELAAGAVVYFIMPQLEESPVCTSPILSNVTAAITRTATQQTIDNSGGTFASQVQLRAWLNNTTDNSVLISDGTNKLRYTGTAYEFTDGTTTLSVPSGHVPGSVIGIDTNTGEMYINGVLVATDPALNVSWGNTIYVGHDSDGSAHITGGVTDIESWAGGRDLSLVDTFSMVAPGQTEYVEPGTYYWECPEGVTEVSVVAVGGGAGGTYAVTAPGGCGGGLGWKNNVPVTPGELYQVVVGSGGGGGSSPTAGGDSYFISTATVCGYGGLVGISTGSAIGGGFVGDGGGNGGGTGATYSHKASGGGGAGGYSGDGGKGGEYERNGLAGDGGGAGGGGGCGYNDTAGGGGGVGIYGEGDSGAGGGGSTSDAGAGLPGSGGEYGSR